MRDAIGIFGLIAIMVGTTYRYGWDVACILGGAIMLTLAVIGAFRK